MTYRSLRIPLLGIALAAATPMLVTSIPAWGQSQSINGTIRGQVTDVSGAAIPGAEVTVSNLDLGTTRKITTASNGYYVLINLPLGTYTVSVSKDGFSTARFDQIILTAGKEAVLDTELKIGNASEQIDVSAAVTNIDPATLSLQRTIDSREVENLPLTSRNPYNFIIFQPGISGHPNQELGIPRTLNTNGLLDRINYQMDGMVNSQSDRIGLRLFPIADIFTKEVQTVSNSFNPEYGGTSGNVFNVISNNGTNAFHGMFQWIRRWQDATAYPFFSTAGSTKPNLKLEDFSVNSGGRIIKDKLFYSGAYEHLERGQPSPVTITAANIAALGLPADQVAPAPGLAHVHFAFGRGDWVINNKNSLFIRYNYYKSNFPYNTQVGSLNVRSTGADYVDRAHVIGMQLTSTINDHLLNELRFSWPLRSNAHTPSVPTTGPAIAITGAANLGATSNAGDQFTDKIPSGSDNVSFVRGAHTFKAGFSLAQRINRQRTLSYNRYTFSATTATVNGQTVTTSAVANYLAALNGTNPYAYTQYDSQTDLNGVGYASLFLGAYAQDTWQVSPRLILIYGARYDRFKSPNANPNAPFVNSRSFNTPGTNFSPRVGFSYRLDDNTVVKASVGMFYQETPTNVWFNALNQDGSNRTSTFNYAITRNSAGVATIPAGAPGFPNVPSTVGTVAKQNVLTVSPKFRNEYTWNANLQFSHDFTRYDNLMIGYIMTSGRNLQYLHNINLINPTGQLADGRPIFSSTANASTRLDPNFNQINQVESGANSSYNALVASYNRKIWRGLQINANYTWSKSISDGPDVNTFEQNLPISDTTNLKRDRSRSIVDHPHAFNTSAVLEPTFALSHGFLNTLANHNMLAVLANLSSGDVQNIVTNVSLNGDPSVTAVTRPLFVGRNALRAPSVYQIDARYTRTFPKLFDRVAPTFFLEANNVFNHTNVTGLTPTQAVNSAGVPTAAVVTNRSSVLEARIVQFGLAARW